MNLKNRTSCLFKIVLFIIFSIFVAEIIVLPKIEHDMLKEAGRQELVTVQQLCGAVLEKNPDVEQDFILGLRQPTKSWQEKGEQILNQYGYDEEHLLADNTLYAAYMIAWRNWTGFFLITTFLLLATSLLYFYSIIRNSNREILLILEQYLSEDFSFAYGTETSVYKGYKRDKIEMRVDRVEVSDFPLYLNTVAGGLDRRDQTIGGFSFVVKIYAVPVVEIIG